MVEGEEEGRGEWDMMVFCNGGEGKEIMEMMGGYGVKEDGEERGGGGKGFEGKEVKGGGGGGYMGK